MFYAEVEAAGTSCSAAMNSALHCARSLWTLSGCGAVRRLTATAGSPVAARSATR